MDEAKKNSILVVDDDTSSLMALTHILSPEYAVYAAKNGPNALETAEKFLPDIVLLDVVMPEMDGYAVISALKNSEKTKNIPVILMTGLDVGGVEKGMALGASDYISKPFDPATVRLRVRHQIQFWNENDLN